FHVWHLRIDSLTGRLLSVADEGFRGVPYPIRRDAEGVAFCPSRNTLFISGEEDQRILEHRLDGALTGKELSVPQWADKSHIQPGRGFEALCYDAARRCFWTVTESPLRGDSALHLRLIPFGEDLQPRALVPYRMDAEQARDHGRDHYHGVVALCTMTGTDDLFVLERECRIAPNYLGSRCWCKVFRFNPEMGEKRLLEAWRSRFHLLDTRMANFEGMCPGPTLADGRHTLLFVSDSQGGYGRALWHLRDYLRILVVE
ncbi:MAG: esterase-like activity of phytase family protein, partial [Bacteroidaceae bacterium]|nr:esterase-like activity of phytase family protein [Bacteroidaceae bacterium]